MRPPARTPNSDPSLMGQPRPGWQAVRPSSNTIENKYIWVTVCLLKDSVFGSLRLFFFLSSLWALPLDLKSLSLPMWELKPQNNFCWGELTVQGFPCLLPHRHTPSVQAMVRVHSRSDSQSCLEILLGTKGVEDARNEDRFSELGLRWRWVNFLYPEQWELGAEALLGPCQ